ncbi:MAG: NifB/NifX family molybdenum-iron cluster-binding protein [Acidobacteriaceae bacterium]
MRIAIPQWQGRVSPVFDVAANLLLVDVEDGHEVRREERKLSGADPFARTAEFLRCGAETLLCGAISAPIAARVAAAGVQVVGFTCGKVDDVLRAYLNGGAAGRAFVMPGCQRWRRWRGENAMPRIFGAGAGQGNRGREQGKGQGLGTDRGGGPSTGQLADFCVCQLCGEKVPHTVGFPCREMSCPKCGGPMTRS